MRIEVLYISGCPNHPPAVKLAREALKLECASADVAELEVKDADAAQAVGFLGSPTIRVDGQDVESSARSSKAFGFTCRTYLVGAARVGVPPVEWIRAAIRQAESRQKAQI